MNEYLKDFICGSIAGLFGYFFSHPLDTLKVYFYIISVESKQIILRIFHLFRPYLKSSKSRDLKDFTKEPGLHL